VFTDTHCHLDFEKFDADRADVLTRARDAGVSRILIPSLDLPTSHRVIDFVESQPMLFAAVGIHPTEVGTFQEDTRSRLRQLAQSPKVVAIGEIGLDYYWEAAHHDLQAKILKEQLALAADLQLPVILHFREKGDLLDGSCARNLLTILGAWHQELRDRNSPLVERPGVLHSFSGSFETANQAMELNYYIGVSGPVTYNLQRQELVATLPLEHLLIETDAPFQAPAPHRGKRNEPAFVTLIADKIAALHSIKIEAMAAVLNANTSRLFVWED
jgi:TatD DNase family protein